MRRAVVAACLAGALCLPVLVLPNAGTTWAASQPSRHYRGARSTAQAYFQVLNSGMTSGDFSRLGSVFASNATLTKSGTDGTTTVYHGLSQITAFYQGLHQKLPNWQWTTDEMRPLDRGIVLAYEHAGSPPLTVASRCVHAFVVKKGKIVSYDWAAFFPGK